MRCRARLAGAAVAAVAGFGEPVAHSSAATTCQLAGTWSQTTQVVGASTWTITADGRAQETGLGYASGTASLSGGVLKITWQTTNGYAGVYKWTLNAQCAGTGTLTWTRKPASETRGTTFASTVTGPPPTESAADPALQQLQRALKRLGLYAGAADGIASPELTAAVKSFQRRVGLPIDGNCDTRCRSALNKALGLDDPKRPPGATPKAPRTVKELQRDLEKLGFYSGPIDGRDDAAVKAAVKRFQRDAGLPVDGRCTSRCQFLIVRRLTKRATAQHSGRMTDGAASMARRRLA